MGSEDAYYEMDIQNIKELLLYWDDFCTHKPNKKHKQKQNRYSRKMYYKKVKHLRKLNTFVPCHVYGYGNTHKYWKKYFVQSKELRHIGNSIIRSTIPGKEQFSLKSGGYRKVFAYWYVIF